VKPGLFFSELLDFPSAFEPSFLFFQKALGPKDIKIYCNRIKLGFNEVDSVPADQEITLTEADLAEGAVFNLKFVKFQKVSNLQIFVENNQGGGEVTRIDALKFYGAPEQTTNMKDLKKVGHDHD